MTYDFLGVRLTCPYCGNKERFHLQIPPLRLVETERAYNRSPRKVSDASSANAAAFGTICEQCWRPLGVTVSRVSVSALLSSVGRNHKTDEILEHSTVITFPRSPKFELVTRLPDPIQKSFEEMLEDAKSRRNPNGILAVARGCLDVALKELKETEGGRSTRIENLFKRGLITEGLAEWANKLWKDGSDAAHDLSGDIDLAIEHVRFLELFFQVVFDIPEKIRESKKDEESNTNTDI